MKNGNEQRNGMLVEENSMGAKKRQKEICKGLASIIVPIYNCRKYLEDNLDFFINQTYEHCEYIFVNDCSADLYDDVIPNRKNIKIINHKRRKGPGEARNSGLTLARGEYIFFFDGDDRPSNEIVRKSICKYKDTHAELIVFNYLDSDKEGLRKDFPNHIYEVKHPILFDNNLAGSVWNKMFLHAVILKHNVRFANNDVANEDICFTIEYISHINSIAFINEPLYIYYINPDSITSQRYSEINSIERFINSAYHIWQIGKLNGENYDLFLHEFLYKCIRLGLRNIVNFKSRASDVLEFLINNKKVIAITNKVKQMGKYDDFYDQLLSHDFTQAMKWLC